MQLIGAGEGGTEITLLSEMYKPVSIPRSLPVAMNHLSTLSTHFSNACPKYLRIPIIKHIKCHTLSTILGC